MKFWIGVASKDHVKKGKEGNFCQVCHGKQFPLKRMNSGDWIIYYSPKEFFLKKDLCQKFTAIGKIIGKEPYQVKMAEGFYPYRLDVEFYDVKEVDIRPLIERLEFIKDKKRWGYNFRFGHFEISKTDFELIKNLMLFSPDSPI